MHSIAVTCVWSFTIFCRTSATALFKLEFPSFYIQENRQCKIRNTKIDAHLYLIIIYNVTVSRCYYSAILVSPSDFPHQSSSILLEKNLAEPYVRTFFHLINPSRALETERFSILQRIAFQFHVKDPRSDFLHHLQSNSFKSIN